MNEAEVIQRVHRHLLQRGLDGDRMARLFTDPHPTLTPYTSLRPFQRFSIGDGETVLHPDLLGQMADGESLVAIEAKGATDHLKALIQAEMYQQGVQRSFVALPKHTLNGLIESEARRRGIGVLAVDTDEVRVLHVPEERRPLNRIYSGLVADLGNAAWLSDGGTFTYNLPTHYLVWIAALAPGETVGLAELRHRVADYPMPAHIRSALSGARKLGLLIIDGAETRLSDVGGTVRELLPTSTSAWASIHRDLVEARGRLMLCERCRNAGVVLRLLLLRDPLVQLVVDGLRSLPGHMGSLVDLAQACSRLDRRKAAIFFLHPETAPSWVPRSGLVDWHSVAPEAFRSTTFFQYKSVLRHAGVLVADALGGSTARHYDPRRDLWRLPQA